MAERQRKLAVLNEYLATIEASISELDAIYNEIVKSFDSIRVPDRGENGSQGAASKLQEIRDIISGKSSCILVVNLAENMLLCKHKYFW